MPESNKLPARGSFTSNVAIIFAAQIIVKLLGMLYRLVITNIDGFGDTGNGFYSAGFQIYTLLLAVSSVGIPSAVSKLISERLAVSDRIGAERIFKTALIIFAVIGAILSASLYMLAAPISSLILKMPGAQYTIAALSPSIFFVCVSSVFRGYFSGLNRMQIMSVSQIVEQFFKSVLTVAFVLLSAGALPEVMSGRANLATTVATVFGAVYLIYEYAAARPKSIKTDLKLKDNFVPTAKIILTLAVPISLCSVISAVNRIIDTATVTRGIETAFKTYIPSHGSTAAVFNPSITQLNAEAVRLSGMLSKSDTLINLPLALNIAFASVLVPSLSKCRAIGNDVKIREYINLSMLTSAVLILPCAAGYIILGRPIYNLIYPNAPLGYELLQLSAISLIFTALNQTVTGALQGLGRVSVPAWALAMGCIVKLILNCVLISVPEINIYGAVIGSIACQFVVFMIEWHQLSKSIDGKVPLRKIFIKPGICCVLMCAVTYFSYTKAYQLFSSNTEAVLISVAVSAAFYGILILLVKRRLRQSEHK